VRYCSKKSETKITTMSAKSPKFTFADFLKRYPNDDACLDDVFSRVYGDLTICPECDKETEFKRVKGRKSYQCSCCTHQLYPLAHTPLKSTKISLTHWFFAILLFSNSKNGVSAKELERQLNISYPTAHRMGHKIREMMNEDGEFVLEGTVEFDETLMGGKKRGGKRGWGADKPCVFGMVERNGRIKTQVVKDRKATTLMPIIVQHTTEDITAYTDEFKGYNKLSREVAFHETVCHGRYEWVRGDVHTNTIEGHWSLVKRSIKGTHTSVSEKYLPKYLNEFAFRHNHRKDCMFTTLMGRIKMA